MAQATPNIDKLGDLIAAIGTSCSLSAQRHTSDGRLFFTVIWKAASGLTWIGSGPTAGAAIADATPVVSADASVDVAALEAEAA